MEGQAARHNFNKEWRIIPTGKKAERSVHFCQLEVHPQYPNYLDDYSDADVQLTMAYILKEGAPSHRLYVMPNPQKPGYYYIIGWLKIYEAYKLLGIMDFIPTLCYHDLDAHKKLWENWKNCPGEIFDIK